MAGGWPVYDFGRSNSLYLFGEDIKFQKKIYCGAVASGLIHIKEVKHTFQNFALEVSPIALLGNLFYIPLVASGISIDGFDPFLCYDPPLIVRFMQRLL